MKRNTAQLKGLATWHEIGRWGDHRIRDVRYVQSGSTFAGMILVEHRPNVFSPLIKWEGAMPEAALYDFDDAKVLAMEKDFGGNIPMVHTWAWIWGVSGPVRLDADSSVSRAVEKVAPGYSAYQTGLDWRSLHSKTWVWKGDYPGKTGVSSTVEAWFELGPEGLVTQRVHFSDVSGDKSTSVYWPRTFSTTSDNPSPGQAGKPSRTEVTVELKDFRGSSVSGAQVRFRGTGVSFVTDLSGRTSVPLPSSVPEGSPMLLEFTDSSRSLVALSPCRGVIIDSRSASRVVVARKGDAGILTNPAALESLADCILRTAPPQEKYEWALYGRHRRQALDTIANDVGVTSGALDAAIRSSGRKARDPLARGLAGLYEQRPDEAVAQLRKAVRTILPENGTAGRLLPARQERLARAEFYLARALYARRHFAESIAAHERSAALRPADSALLASWGWALGAIGDYNGAELHLRRAFTAQELAFGPDSESVGVLAIRLADSLYRKPDFDEIETLIRRALDIAEQTRGAEGASYAEALHNLAVLKVTTLDSESAKTLFRQALNIRQQTVGPDNPETADSIDELATVLYHQRRSCPEALPLFQRALDIREKAFGQIHPATVRSINAIGLCHEETGDLPMAEVYYRRAQTNMESAVGEFNSTTADYMSNLSAVLLKRQRPEEAEPLQRRALEIQEALLGPGHPYLIDTIHKLAMLLCAGGRVQECEQMLRRCVAIREKASGSDSLDLGQLLSDLGAILLNEGNASEAEPTMRRALDILERRAGPNHEDTAKSLNDLAILLDRKGQPEQSAPLFERALAIYRTTLGPQSEEAAAVEALLTEVLRKLERPVR